MFRITRPEGSQRHFFTGIALKTGESIYIDMQEAANHFLLRAGWLVEEVDEVPKDYVAPESLLENGKPPAWMKDGLISVLRCPSLKVLLREEIQKIEEAPKGAWEIYEKPAEWTNPFLYGYDTRKLPFKVGDYRVVQQFSAKGFSVRDAKTGRPLNIVSPDADLLGGIKPKGKSGKLLSTTDFQEEPKI